VRDLLGDGTRPGRELAPEDKDRPLGFSNNAAVMGVTTLLGEQLMVAAETLAAAAVADLPRLVPCAAAGDEDGCARRFIERFGMRAWRRPLEAEERADLVEVYAAGQRRGGLAEGIRALLVTLLQAPEFLYRIEGAAGGPAAAGPAGSPLDSFEMASRLSYLIWNSMPDEELFAAAAADRLRTPAEIEQQARRMLGDARTRDMVAAFHAQWLDLDKLERLEKSRAAFKTWRRDLGGLFRRETELFVDEIVRTGGGLRELLTAPFTFVDATLAAFYGLPAPAGEGFAKVATDGERRGGLLTQASFLAGEAKHNQTSPVLRGKFVREQLLCMPPPPPPPNVNTVAPEVDKKLTTRERFEDHRADIGCAKCHKLMDPIGLGFENYDGVGLWRSSENGKPIDAEGEIVRADVAGAFVGAVALERKLAASRQAARCFVTQWFRYAYGRNETPEDRCTLAFLERRYGERGESTHELIVALTQTEAFLRRRAPAGVGAR
jgi:hypothetical protein